MDYGCAYCVELGFNTPAQEFHHIHTDAKRRAGRDIGIGLCVAHHPGCNDKTINSRHPNGNKAEWERLIGMTEWELYEKVCRGVAAAPCRWVRLGVFFSLVCAVSPSVSAPPPPPPRQGAL